MDLSLLRNEKVTVGVVLRTVVVNSTMVVLLLVLSSLPVRSQPLTAQEVLDRSFAAQGGKENLERIKTLVASGKVEVLGGFVGSYESSAQAPNKLRTKWDIEVIQQERGYDGVNGWEKLASVRELNGRDLVRLKRSALFNPLLTYTETRVPVELIGQEKVNDVDTYVIEFRPIGSFPERFYFNARNFLPVKDVLQEPYEEGDIPVTTTYGDYRKVGDVLLPFSINEPTPDQPLAIRIEKYQLNVPLADKDFQNPMAGHFSEPYEISLTTIPIHVFKENDGPWTQGWQRFWAIPYGPTESFLFNIVVNEIYGRQLEPVSALLEFYSGQKRVQTQELSLEALRTLKKFPVTRYAPQPEIFDIRHYFSEPAALGIDNIVYTIELTTPSGLRLRKSLTISLTYYHLKRKYIFPLTGKFVVLNGHEFYELGHKYEWSQHYAYDIFGVGPNLELAKNDGENPEDFFGWGREIVAPADGVVVYARNDVPNMMAPKDYLKLPDSQWAIGGNIILIDHGNGEASLFAHSQYGSVRVRRGDHVKQGQVIALLGCSGAPGTPHLHYQLQAGTKLFSSDGLPTQFGNLEYVGRWGEGEAKAITPKRGIYMEAK
jgi:Peptidase family M23